MEALELLATEAQALESLCQRKLRALDSLKKSLLHQAFSGAHRQTFIAFQIAWKLFHSRWNLSREPTRRPRILFLADRNILANQAYNAFSAFPEDALVRIKPEDIRKKGKVPKNGSLFFTIYDFVKAHHHFSDPEWDGEPLEPEPKEPKVPKPGPKEPGGIEEPPPLDYKRKAKINLADGKARSIQHMMCTTFWHPDGTPMSAQQFMEMLFGKLPEFFKDEAELRALWSAPDTRKKLLHGLAEKGFGHQQLAEMQKIIDAEKSDLFDVLAHVAYAMPPVTRELRAAGAKARIDTSFNAKQRVFLDFVLQHYVSVGVEELDQDKLTPLLRLRYHNSLADAVADLGAPEEIGRVFAGFQKFLYEPRVAA